MKFEINVPELDEKELLANGFTVNIQIVPNKRGSVIPVKIKRGRPGKPRAVYTNSIDVEGIKDPLEWNVYPNCVKMRCLHSVTIEKANIVKYLKMSDFMMKRNVNKDYNKCYARVLLLYLGFVKKEVIKEQWLELK